MSESEAMNNTHKQGSTATRRRPRRGFTLLELVIVIGVILVLMGLVLGVGSMVVAQSETRQLDATMTIIDASLSEFENQTGRSLLFEGAFASGSNYRYDHAGHAAFYCEGVNSGFYFDVPYAPYRDTRFTNATGDGGFGWDEVPCPPWENNLGSVRRQWMSATLSVLAQNPVCAEIMAKADPTLVHNVQCVIGSTSSEPVIRTLDIKEFIDPWQQQVYIVFPGRDFVDCDRSSEEGIPPQQGVRDADGTIRTVEELRYGICRNGRPLLVSAGPDSRFGNLLEDISSDEYANAQDNIYSYEPAQP